VTLSIELIIRRRSGLPPMVFSAFVSILLSVHRIKRRTGRHNGDTMEGTATNYDSMSGETVKPAARYKD
jgi:hypothetical protein